MFKEGCDYKSTLFVLLIKTFTKI